MKNLSNKQKFIDKKNHFFFNNDFSGYILLNFSRSNLFLTLLDWNKHVVITKTSGCTILVVLNVKNCLYKLLIV